MLRISIMDGRGMGSDTVEKPWGVEGRSISGYCAQSLCYTGEACVLLHVNALSIYGCVDVASRIEDVALAP